MKVSTKFALRASGVATAAAAMVVGVSVPANAVQFNGICDTKEVCIYQRTYLNGGWIDHQYADPNYSNNTYTGGGVPEVGTNDRTSSIDSWDTNWKVRFFVDSYYGGARQTVAEYARLNTVEYNDAYSSHCWNDGGVSGYSQCNF